MSVEDAVEDLKEGKFIIMIDDEKRENEGDLIIPAEKVNEEKLNFMLKIARGILCLPMSGKRLDELGIPMMVQDPTDKLQTPFTVSIDHKTTTTGVSVPDRIKTIKAILDKNSKPEDFHRPGHIFPLRANDKLLEGRKGHTEAAVELMNLANLQPVALIAEILDQDGSMPKLESLKRISKEHGIRIIHIEDITNLKKKG
ncbi:3,4-dihydroxy-2-butanone-4-phosphate synthase [Nanoarchaeota archaeon]